MISLSRTMMSELAVNFATCETENLISTTSVVALCDFQDQRYDAVLGMEYEPRGHFSQSILSL